VVQPPNKQHLSGLLQSLSRQSAKSQLEGLCHRQDAEIRELRLTEDYSQEHWIVAIVVSAKALNICFRTHFSIAAATNLAVKGFGLSAENVTSEVAKDCIGEFCNLTAGSIRRTLQKAKVIEDVPGLSLPTVHKAEDYVAAPKHDVIDCWAMQILGSEVICASNLSIFDWERVRHLEATKLATMLVSDAGTISFLPGS